MQNNDKPGPLTETTFLVLLSLLIPRHGYAVMQNIETASDGRVMVGPGTLYGALKGMVKKGWIRELDGQDQRRREYVVTAAGRDVLRQETERLRDLARLGETNLGGLDVDNESKNRTRDEDWSRSEINTNNHQGHTVPSEETVHQPGKNID